MPSEGEDFGVGEGEGAGKVMPASKRNINYMKQRPREKLMPADQRHSQGGKEGRALGWERGLAASAHHEATYLLLLLGST